MKDKPILRREIMLFALAMEGKMLQNDGKKGDSWKVMHMKDLMNGLACEYEEWITIVNPKELLDIANYCMMIWNRMVKPDG